jgi:hypothetical protein
VLDELSSRRSNRRRLLRDAAKSGSSVDRDRLASVAAFVTRADSMDALDTEESASVWGTADANCVNAVMYPTEQVDGG